MEEDNKKIVEFRGILKSIKNKVLDKLTYNTQDTTVLNKVVKRLIQFYLLLKPVVYENKPLETIAITELEDLFYDTLKEHPRSSYYQNQIEYYLKRDFIDFPFSLDEIQINSFNTTEHYEEPSIIENNMTLTE
jgi:hypothetical protein